MTVQEASREYVKALQQREDIEQRVRLQESEQRRKARKAEKAELKESARVFESLGLPPAAAAKAAEGRDETRF